MDASLTALVFLLPAINTGGFTGSRACAPCHRSQFDRQSESYHAHALRPIGESGLPGLLTDRPIRERSGIEYSYQPDEQGLRVTATSGGKQVSALLQWAFGAGAQGITPVGRLPSGFFEHRISWYTQRRVPGVTFGHPASPGNQLGETQSGATIYRCFNCHATNAKPGPNPAEIEPGVTCERCHGPGAPIVEARAG